MVGPRVVPPVAAEEGGVDDRGSREGGDRVTRPEKVAHGGEGGEGQGRLLRGGQRV